MKDNIKDNVSSSLRKILWQTLLVFFFIYEVQPIGVPDILTSRKLVFFLCVGVFLAKRNFKFRLPSKTTLSGRTVISLFLLSIVMLGWVFLLSIVNSIGSSVNGESILSRTLLFVFFVPLICYFMYDCFDNSEQFLKAVFYATLLQATIAIFQYFSDGVKHFLYNRFVLDTNFSYLSPFRAAGLGAGEALLSINLFIGMVAGAYFMIKKKRLMLYTLGYVYILFATMLAGSTGLALGTALLVLVVLYLVFVKYSVKGVRVVVIGLLGCVALFVIYPEFFSSIENFGIYRKIKELLEGGADNSSFVTSLLAQEVAPISVETIIGTSIYRGYSGSGVLCRSDTGYIQAYFGYGLIMAVVFYVCLYRVMLKNIIVIKNRDIKFIIMFFFAAIVVVEAKEPFIHHFGLPFAFFMTVFLQQKQEQREKCLLIGDQVK